MAGVKGRSGRPPGSPRAPDGSFGRSSPSKLDTSTPAPVLDGTPEANQQFCSWVALETALGNIDPRTADSLIGSARAEQGAVRLRHGLNEIETLRGYVERMESAVKNRTRQEQADRYTSSTGAVATFGRVKSGTPDGDPH